MKTCLNCKTENPDDAKYCQSCRFTLDWETTEPEEAADITRVLPPPTLELTVGPGEARVTAGNHAAFGVRVVNRGGLPGRARLLVAGPAAAFATVAPAEVVVEPGAASDAQLTIAVPPDAAPATIPVDVYATEAGGSGASIATRASLTIDPRPHAQEPQVVPGRRRRLAPVAAVVGAVAAGAIGYSAVSEEGIPVVGDGISGTVRTQSESGTVCFRESAGGPRVPPGEGQAGTCSGISNGDGVKVDCREGAWLRLKEPEDGRFIFADFVELDEEPPGC